MIVQHYTFKAPMRKTSSMLKSPAHLVRGGSERSEQGVVLPYKAPMRLIAKTLSGQMRISVSKCSPSGELREAVRGQTK